ncbi:MAG TPA: ABC transporter substrate-binding protein [Thermomicrobiales bacterium]|nr:ABC transporter substrate-binding protein [Thermomicrobiales bacterium]
MDKNLDRWVKQTSISRRDFMKVLGVAGAAAGLTGTGAKAFASGTSGEPRVLSVNQSNGDRPELVIGVTGLPPVLDPAQGSFFSIVGSRTTPIFHEPLLDIDYKHGNPVGFGSNIIPALAEGWQQVDDTTLDVFLRDGILFQDGTPITADDVVYTINRIIDPNTDPKLKAVTTFFSTFKSVEAIDPKTVRVTTKQPDATLLDRLTVAYIVPKAVVEKDGIANYALMPIGAGAYKVSEFVPNDHLTLESFDQFYGGTPPFSKVTIRVIVEVATRMAAFSSNEIQLTTDVPPDQISQLQGDSNNVITSIGASNAHFLFFNTKQKVLSDVRMRQALTLSIDRQLLVDTLWMGNADLMRGYQVPEWGSMYNPDRPFFTYDLDQAKKLLDEVDYDGTEISFRGPDGYYPLGNDAIEAIVGMWQDLGIKAKVDLLQPAAYTASFPTLMVGFISAGLNPFDPEMNFSTLWDKNGTFQADFWTPEDPKFNQDLDLLTSTLDTKARFNAYQEALDIWEKEVPATMLYRIHAIYGQKKSVGWTPYTVFNMDLRPANFGTAAPTGGATPTSGTPEAGEASPIASPEASPAS